MRGSGGGDPFKPAILQQTRCLAGSPPRPDAAHARDTGPARGLPTGRAGMTGGENAAIAPCVSSFCYSGLCGLRKLSQRRHPRAAHKCARILALHGSAMTGGIQASFNQARKRRCASSRGILFQLMLDWVPACDASGIAARRRRDDGRKVRCVSSYVSLYCRCGGSGFGRTVSDPEGQTPVHGHRAN